MSHEEMLAAFSDVRFTFDRGRVACPCCGAAPGVECAAPCRLRGLSRIRQPCATCESDARICGCAAGEEP